jgi:plastocyanin
MNVRRPILSLALALATAACSLADGEPPPSVQAPSGRSGATAASESPTLRRARHVDPRRNGLELGFGEFAITLEAEEIRPGPVTIVVRNGGKLVHGFEIKVEERDGDHSGSGHSGDGDGFEAEGPAFGPGEVVRIPLDLAPGVYEIECFVAEHDDLGMRATLVVRRGAPLVSADTKPTAPDRVEIADFAFAPAQIEIGTGTEVTWRNVDPTSHTATSRDGSFDSGTLDPGSEFSTTFDRAGTFKFFCQIHPRMQGVVRVVDPTRAGE